MSVQTKTFDVRSVKVALNRIRKIQDAAIWKELIKFLTQELKLQVKLDIKRPMKIQMRSPENDHLKLQRGISYIEAYMKGFDIENCAFMSRNDGIYVRSLDIKDVKLTMKGDHLTRAVGRVCGHNGIMRKKLENTTRTRIVVHDSMVHIMGPLQSIGICYRQIGALARGAKINKVAGDLGYVKKCIDSIF